MENTTAQAGFKALRISMHTTLGELHVFLYESHVDSYRLKFDGENQCFLEMDMGRNLIVADSGDYLVKDGHGNVHAYTEKALERTCPNAFRVVNEDALKFFGNRVVNVVELEVLD